MAGQPSLIFTGGLAAVLLIAAPLALLVSFICLRLYLRAVKRLMLGSAGLASAPGKQAGPSAPPSAALAFTTIGDDGARASKSRRAVSGPWKTFAVYAIAGLAYAVCTGVLYLQATATEFAPWRLALAILSFAFPLVITWGLVAALTWRGWLVGAAVYAAALIAFALLYVATGPSDGLVQVLINTLFFWILTNAELLLLTPMFLIRPIRAIGPLAFIAMIAAVAGALSLPGIFGASDDALRAFVAVGSRLGLGADNLFLLLVAGGIAGGTILGWFLLRGVAALYRERWVTDQSLVIDSVWLLYAVTEAIQRQFDGQAWSLSALVPFVIYKLVSWLGFRIANRRTPTPRPLLLLRVFALGRRSETLFRALTKPWRHLGPIRLIAGPDLATTTIEPHEILDFMGGSLKRHFIENELQLSERLSLATPRPDFDGRFRVDELFCHDDTWTMALRAIVGGSHAVLMDLRGFAPANKGCVFEIEQLLDRVPLHSIVFVVDATTDRAFLQASFATAWSKIAIASPNRALAKPQVRLFPLTAMTRGTIASLAAALLAPKPQVGEARKNPLAG